MKNRFSDAWAIQQGACNPSGIAHAIVNACAEIRALPNHSGTAQITGDSAVRLMVHQLAYICGIGDSLDGMEYSRMYDECKNKAESK